MSGTCHNWLTFESGFFNNMPLGATSPIAVWKGAVMQTSPGGAMGAAWLTLACPTYVHVLTNTLFALLLPLTCSLFALYLDENNSRS